MPPKAPPPFVANKKLILHFDVEDVLVLTSKQNDEAILQLATEYAWGRIEQKDAKSAPAWKLHTPALSKTPPEEGLMSYRAYVEGQYPIGKNPAADTEAEKAKADLYANFVKGPGAKLKSQIQKLTRNISVPKSLIEYLHAEQQSKEEQSQNYKSVVNLLASGKMQILPSFYKLLLTLKKAKRQFAVVFHGQDGSQELIKELNLFYSGEHPLYNGKNNTPLNKFDGSKGTKNFKIGDKNSAVRYRFEHPFTGDCATFGTRKVFKEKDLQGLKLKIQETKSDIKICTASEIYSYSHVLLRESASLFYIDKIHTAMVDPVDYNTLEIYFYNGNCDVVSCLGEVIPNTEGRMSVKVELFELLKDIDFFSKMVEVCEKNRAQQIEKIERGGAPAQQQKPKVEEQLSDTEYLKQTIFPLLDGALRIVDIERPEDPIAVIALYCLKNKHRIKKPEPVRPPAA